MIKRLKALYPSLITDEERQGKGPYYWFTTSDNQLIGILENEIKEKEHELLDLLLTPYHGAYPPVTEREQAWYDWIFEGTNFISAAPKEYRFIYFSLSDALSDPNDFREAIYGMYSYKPVILFSSQKHGVIIEEERPDEDDTITFFEMIEVFTSDFFIDVHFFIGPYLRDLKRAHDYHHWMDEQFHHIQHFNTKPVMTYISSVPYLMSVIKDQTAIQFLIEAVLKSTVKDEELLRTIQTFLEANSNASLAAKEMYMHRNSLQYRIDKFVEKTEVDVKQFEGAVAVYLILLLKRQIDLA
ncbi:hypothetical protein GCM10012290_16260 [Halolactibacillus alkaliphilus]|uniref:PucR C-terminal helix-turn-helix domain-containing protein n=1 Tax=Halolactibacillus alkaliphilus TaxID=442899 RepID=A0A511X1R6_9BACI|nr:helix-turn-helix domain-containing protein [Halolactibacillus alkaliphilus]GEN56860.1 hypothetical protein HAL01_13240 [Halolactibacillus alkaliphilus]GGN71404.1 hypothetical protein GCM10012290_16260 [Halolactibacillus alkaliphilus]SFO82278.1 PucR C-terminal helix-turn-helix domain-containing protein [Halolactibacillus alkaliphilus]